MDRCDGSDVPSGGSGVLSETLDLVCRNDTLDPVCRICVCYLVDPGVQDLVMYQTCYLEP